MSKYTAQQIYALGQFIVAHQRQFPNYYIGNEIRHLEYNAQRNLADKSEEYFVKYLHTTVDKVMNEVTAYQFKLTQLPKETHAPPTSLPPGPPKRRIMVIVPCFVCQKDTPVAEDVADQAERTGRKIWCSEACYKKSVRLQNNAVSELQKFLTAVGSRFYDCDYNSNLMTGWLRDHQKTVTEENLFEAFMALRGQLLTSLTPAQLDAMTSAELTAREKIDPQLGGCNLGDVRKLQSQIANRGAAVSHSSNAGFGGAGR